MDHCLLFCYCILVVYIYDHIVLHLSSCIIFSVSIEIANYMFIMCSHVLAVASPQDITKLQYLFILQNFWEFRTLKHH